MFARGLQCPKAAPTAVSIRYRAVPNEDSSAIPESFRVFHRTTARSNDASHFAVFLLVVSCFWKNATFLSFCRVVGIPFYDYVLERGGYRPGS